MIFFLRGGRGGGKVYDMGHFHEQHVFLGGLGAYSSRGVWVHAPPGKV